MPHLWLEGLQTTSSSTGLSNIIQRLLPKLLSGKLLLYIPLNRRLRSFHNDTLQRLRLRSSELQDTNARHTLSEILIQKRPDIPEDLLASQANTIIQAGCLHMSTFLTTTTYHLLANPTIFERATDEIRKSYSELCQIDNTSLQNLPYLASIIEEGLRILPPAPFGATSVSHGAVVAGVSIPPGTIVSSCTYAITRSALNFTSAPSFLPQRWLRSDDDPGQKNQVATDTLTASKPFGLGPRACPGMEMAYMEARIVLAKMLWAFDLKVEGEVEGWEGRVRWNGGWKLPNVRVRLVPVVREEGSEVLV
jgi:cytochrome P450